MKLAVLAVLMTGLAACAPSGVSEPSPRTDPIPFQLDARGVQLVGQSLRIDFGRTDHSTELAMTKLVGQAAVSRSICADGRPFVTWPDGSTLYFSGGAFRGWSKAGTDGAAQKAGVTCA